MTETERSSLSRRRRLLRWLLVMVLLGFAALNVLACFHARAMMHFVSGTERTHEPETLTLLQKVKVLATGVKIPRRQITKRP
jgi:hypothetical protein